ncbi:MAG TPA: hypothetical protein VGJ77_10565 [Gaiellaceae bacterium]|jgi:hypothetical protein
MRTRLALIATAALVAGGCGGGSTGKQETAASLAPASAPTFVSLDLRRLQRADDVVAKFPIRDRALAEARKAIRGYGIDVDALRRSAGRELDIAVLDQEAKQAVGFARPPDEKRFERALDRSRLVHQSTNGWTTFSRDPAALAAVQQADAKLADAAAYRRATERLPDDAFATAYVAGREAREYVKRARWASAALLTHDEGIELQAFVDAPGLPGARSYDAALADLIPDGSVAAVSFRDLGDVVRRSKTELLGIQLADLADAFDGEGILYVRPGALIPEVTLVTKGGDEAALHRIVRALAPKNAQPTKTTIEGVTLNELALGPVTILYGAVGGKLVITDNANAIRALKTGDRPKLADDDSTFKAVRDAAHMPDETNGWLYLNVEDGLPLVEAIAQLANEKLPRAWVENLRVVRSALVYGTREGDTQTLVAFVQTH